MRWYSKIEVKIGIVVFVGFVLLAIIILSIENIRLKKYTLFFYFDYISGLESGAPVRLSGMHVGEVRQVSMEGDKIKVAVDIDSSIKIPCDSRVCINALGLMGERYVEIIRGKEEKKLRPNDVLYGTNPVLIEEMFIRGERLLTKLAESILVLEDILRPDQLRQIFILIEELSRLSSELKNFLSSTNKLIKDISYDWQFINKSIDTQKIKDIVDNLSSACQKINKSIDTQKIKDIINNLSLLLKNLLEFSGSSSSD